MNEWFKNVIEKIRNFWKSSSVIVKIVVVGIALAVIGAIIFAVNVSGSDSTVRLFPQAVTDESVRNQILDRVAQENVQVYVNDEGVISVNDEKTARRLRTLLTVEGLAPSNYDPFADFYNRSWSTTDAEQNVRHKNALSAALKQHLESLSDIDVAFVTLVLPDKALFASEQNPVSASIALRLSRTSDLLTNRRKVKGIQDYILKAVEGLSAENLTIIDQDGNILNDFEGMAESDRVSIIEKQQKLIRKMEAQLEAKVLTALQHNYTSDRITDVIVHYEMDMSEKNSDSTIYSPIQIKPDNPDTPYDDSEYRDTLPISQQTVTKEWQGTGYNPEGPAGVEGQTPPVYSDVSNVIGKSTETGVTQNNVINTTHTTEKVAPQLGRITISANIDGVWRLKKDPKTHEYLINDEDGSLVREYTPISSEDLDKIQKYVEAAVGYSRNRNDMVTITNIPIDHTQEFREFDEAYFKKLKTRRTILLVLAAVAVVLIGFILFRIISKEIERRRRAREEELLRQQQLAREQALWEAKDEAQTVTMSVEESRRAELQENAINMAKEHPEDVAMLIRTWLMEE
ncbi:MAG: flagellar basal-body MS-ring/collar protein FliF [Treponema sp.]|jgi:flagellar M-ring protein FliF|nr:flagellar basal-body MS-ring/collar protein FliF [Treponema sp.]